MSKSHPPSEQGVHVITVHDQQRAGSTTARLGLWIPSPPLIPVLLCPSVCLDESLSVFLCDAPALKSSQCGHLHNVLVGGACGKMSIAIGSCHRRCGNADDCCGDLAALAVQGSWLIYAHVQTGAAIGRKGGKKTMVAISLCRNTLLKVRPRPLEQWVCDSCPRPVLTEEKWMRNLFPLTIGQWLLFLSPKGENCLWGALNQKYNLYPFQTEQTTLENPVFKFPLVWINKHV